MIDTRSWNNGKMWLAPVASVVLWAVSVLCFVYGLSFENQFVVFNTNLASVVALALALCNTVIQLIGNGKTFTEDDWVFGGIWLASYVLGISTNAYALLQILGINNMYLEWMVSLSLGTIIEIAPEKLIIIWLKSVGSRRFNQQHSNKPLTYPPVNTHKGQPPKYQAKHKPSHLGNPQWPPREIMEKIRQEQAEKPILFHFDEEGDN